MEASSTAVPARQIRSVTIEWVNGGRPFEVGRGQLSPNDVAQATIAKTNAMKEHLAGLGELDSDSRQAIIKEVQVIAEMARVEVLVHSFLSRIDPRVAKMKPEEVREKLNMEQLQAIT